MRRIVLAILIVAMAVLAPGCYVGAGVRHHHHHCATPQDAGVAVDDEKTS